RRRPTQVATLGADSRARPAPHPRPPPTRPPGRALRPLRAVAPPDGPGPRGPPHPRHGARLLLPSVPSASGPALPPRPHESPAGRGYVAARARGAAVGAGYRTTAAPPGHTTAQPRPRHRHSPAGPLGVLHQGPGPAPA